MDLSDAMTSPLVHSEPNLTLEGEFKPWLQDIGFPSALELSGFLVILCLSINYFLFHNILRSMRDNTARVPWFP